MGAYTRSTYNGAVLNLVTIQAVKEAEKRLGYSLTIVQGSYSTGVAASGGTHDGGGALDLAPFDAARKQHVTRAVGFAAWHRLPIPGVWGEHVHCELLGDADASLAAKEQWTQYRNHQDGLADHGPDNSWHPDPIPVWKYKPVPQWGISVQRLHTDFVIALGGHVKNRPTWRGRVVQRLLNKRAGTNLRVDGVIGPETVAAWRKWERKIGATARPGVPDKHSLRRLLRFTLYFASK